MFTYDSNQVFIEATKATHPLVAQWIKRHNVEQTSVTLRPLTAGQMHGWADDYDEAMDADDKATMVQIYAMPRHTRAAAEASRIDAAAPLLDGRNDSDHARNCLQWLLDRGYTAS